MKHSAILNNRNAKTEKYAVTRAIFFKMKNAKLLSEKSPDIKIEWYNLIVCSRVFNFLK
ncbi:hypothetical protein SAMN05421638_1736 [Kaistella treverensis]|uniref:Uncharacterized protein n=1 Tax=Kaistella treverensis TaxID=631455 RepID=A0A1I3MRG5_9FLAO|nr:hypothetical protein SAMN05421638_1736 [Kaistella treverensis]